MVSRDTETALVERSERRVLRGKAALRIRKGRASPARVSKSGKEREGPFWLSKSAQSFDGAVSAFLLGFSDLSDPDAGLSDPDDLSELEEDLPE